jgi:hypothetical protein
MAERSPDFWNLDLTKLTWAGWLLMLLTLATLIGVAVALMALYEALGWSEQRSRGWIKVAVILPAVAAASGTFVLGRWCLSRAGLSIFRPDKR